MSGPLRLGRLTVLPWTSSSVPAPADAEDVDEGSPAGPLCGELRSDATGRAMLLVASALDGAPHDVWRDNPVVVRVFHDGVQIATHRLAEVATRADLFESVSQTRWTRSVGPVRERGCVIETRRGSLVFVALDTGEIHGSPAHGVVASVASQRRSDARGPAATHRPPGQPPTRDPARPTPPR